MSEAMWFEILIGVAVKSALVFGVAWLTSIGLRRSSAAVRHLVWTAAMAASVALPFLSLSLPALRVPVLSAVTPGVAALFQTTATARTGSSPATPAAPQVSASIRWAPVRDPRGMVLLLWTVGTTLFIVQMLIAYALVCRRRSRARIISQTYVLEQLAADLGIRQPELVEGEAGSMPMTCGFLRPAIFMPADAATWDADRQRMVLLHELAHVRRGDVATQGVARLALALNWWNPLAWIAWRGFLKERERAADDIVLARGARASDYAAHLLGIAGSRLASVGLASASVAMARRSQLEGRLVAILDSHINRMGVRRASALGAIGAAFLLTVPFAAVRAQDQPAFPSDIEATIRAGTSQKNFKILELPAEALEAARQFDSAKRLLDAALAVRGQVAGTGSVEYGLGLMRLGELEKKRNQPKEAVAVYAKALAVLGDRKESAPALVFLGVEMLGAKDFARAMDYFQRAQNVDASQSGPIQTWMALVLEREQNTASAESLFASSVAMQYWRSSEAATTMELYARFLRDQGRTDEAKALSDRAAGVRKSLGEQDSVRSDAYHIGRGVTPPKLVSKMEPEYSEEARVAKYEGTTILSVDIGADGFAHSLRVVKGLGFGLDDNAVTAVQQWRFQPGTKDGAPVPVQATIEVNFRLL